MGVRNYFSEKGRGVEGRVGGICGLFSDVLGIFEGYKIVFILLVEKIEVKMFIVIFL